MGKNNLRQTKKTRSSTTRVYVQKEPEGDSYKKNSVIQRARTATLSIVNNISKVTCVRSIRTPKSIQCSNRVTPVVK